VASGLVLALTATAAGAAPAVADQPPAEAARVAVTATGEAAGSGTSFVQEGTPAAQGGRIMAWDSAEGLARSDGSRPWELPDGVEHTGLDVNGSGMLALRSDGQVTAISLDAGRAPLPIPDLPAGLRYTAVSLLSGMGQPAAVLLRSDGTAVGTGTSSYSIPHLAGPPAGMRYIAIDSGNRLVLAVRSDGALVARAQRGAVVPCPEALTPPAGSSYEAVNVHGRSWMALRSDGAVVSCLDEIDTVARVSGPTAGTRFVGVDTSDQHGYAARSDGVIVPFGAAPDPAVVPSGRSVVGLSTGEAYVSNGRWGMNGGALLDDGSLLTWGTDRDLPQLPPGHSDFRALAGTGYASWLLADTELLPTELSVTGVPDQWQMDTSATISVDVTSSSGVTPRGIASIGYRNAEGAFEAEYFLTLDEDGHAESELRMGWPGTRLMEVRFDGPPFRSDEVQRPFTVPEPARTTVTVDAAESWRTGTERIPFAVTVGTVDGTPAVSGAVHILDRATGEHLYRNDQSLDVSSLAPGHHQLEVRHVAHYDAASSEPVIHAVTVRPPSPTKTTARIVNETVHYQNQIDVEARVETLDGSPLECGGLVAELTDGTVLGGLAWGCSDTSSLELTGSAHTFELPPGRHQVVVRWKGTPESDAASPDAGPTLESTTDPLSFTIRRPGTSTLILGITEDVGAGTVRVDVRVNGPDAALGEPGEIILSVNGSDLATRTTDESGRTSFVLDAADLPYGMLVVGARYTGSDRHQPSQTVTGWEHEQKVFVAPNPTVTGTAKVDSTLALTMGAWSPSPAAVAYTWQADGATIAGATSSRLKVPASASGKQITVRVTGTRLGYPAKSVTSAPTSKVAPGTLGTQLPTTTGAAKVGRTLTVDPGYWYPAPSSMKYVWKANGKTVATRTSDTLVVPPSVKGKRLTVTAVGSKAGYTTMSVTSAATATVVPGTIVAPRPTVTGAKRVRSTLTVSKGWWSPRPSSVVYVWKANGVKLATRTSSRFVVPVSARGKRLTVTVIGSRTGYTTKSVTSYRTVTIR
jgi:hypothetical protein